MTLLAPKGSPGRQSAEPRLPSGPHDPWDTGWMDADWSGSSVGTNKCVTILPLPSCPSGTEALAGHFLPVPLSLVPSHSQRLLLETPLGDRLGLSHPKAPVSARFAENRAGPTHTYAPPSPRETTGVVKKEGSNYPRPRLEAVLCSPTQPRTLGDLGSPVPRTQPREDLSQ